MCSAGGTIAQCMAPVISAVLSLKQRDYFAIAVCSCWLATNFWEIAIYAADARALQLNLVAPGMGAVPVSEGSIIHDWHYMLGELGWLQHDTMIALGFKMASFACLALGLGLGSWLITKMFHSRAEL
ncbi:MAG: hypothetical protein ACI87A_003302 [Planctomycetota bacterium]|jgi:hypothetical protein